MLLRSSPRTKASKWPGSVVRIGNGPTDPDHSRAPAQTSPPGARLARDLPLTQPSESETWPDDESHARAIIRDGQGPDVRVAHLDVSAKISRSSLSTAAAASESPS
jgi:hypothetical protein